MVIKIMFKEVVILVQHMFFTKTTKGAQHHSLYYESGYPQTWKPKKKENKEYHSHHKEAPWCRRHNAECYES